MIKKVSIIINNPLFTGSGVMIIGSNTANAINYLYHLIMGRLLGPSSYGELATLISLIGMLSIITASVSLVVTKYVSASANLDERENLIGWFKTRAILISLLIFTLILLISPFLASFLKIDKISYLILIAISSLFSFAAVINRAILQGILKFKEMVLTILAENSFKVILSIALIYLGYELFGAMLAFSLATLIGWYLANAYLRSSTMKLIQTPPNLKSMIIYTFPVIIQTMSTTSLYSSDLILVKHFFSSHEAGIYAALSTLGKIIFFGAGPISTAMFPLVSQRQAQGDNYKRIFLYSLILTAVMSVGLLAVYWLFPALAINLLYGSAYLEAKDLLLYFGIFMSLFTICSLFINFNLSLGKTKVVLFPLFASILQIVLIWFYHENIKIVILISSFVTALLLGVLLIYSSYGDKLNFGNSASLPTRENHS